VPARGGHFYFSAIVECDTFPRMPDNNLTNNAPQFSTAEYRSQRGEDRCKSCNQPIGAEYFRVNGALACPNCAQQASGNLPTDSHARFVRGVSFGVGGAVLGMILYAAFGILTGLVIGYVALGVGYIVARAVKMGSNGMGGRRYQIAAAVLTYAAVSMAAVPMGIAQYVKAKQSHTAATSAQALKSPGSGEVTSGEPNDLEPTAIPQPAPRPARSPVKIGSLIGSLLFAGLASPFYDLWENGPTFGPLIGIFILFIGVRIAWQMTAGSAATGVIGPFKT
jgi:hypothetical protein